MPARLLLLAVVPVLASGLSACGSSIEQAELEAQVAGSIQSEFGVAAVVSCPGDLGAEVNATAECTVIDPATDEEIALRIVVTSVEDGTADFDIRRVG